MKDVMGAGFSIGTGTFNKENMLVLTVFTTEDNGARTTVLLSKRVALLLQEQVALILKAMQGDMPE